MLKHSNTVTENSETKCLSNISCGLSLHQDRKVNTQLMRPTPPSFGPGFVSEYQQPIREECVYREEPWGVSYDYVASVGEGQMFLFPANHI